MKDRVREALFNLIGPAVRGTHAVDLFAGTGALGLEAVSRGAAQATFIEQHFPTAAVVRKNIAALGVQDRCEVLPVNAFLWIEHHSLPGDRPWTLFSSPPYDYYLDCTDQMLSLLSRLLAEAPPGSVLAVESDERFDIRQIASPNGWNRRSYSPALVGVTHKS